MEAKDFTSYLIYINIYMMVLILSYFLFFNTEYRREKVNIVIVKLQDITQHYTTYYCYIAAEQCREDSRKVPTSSDRGM